MTDKQPEALRIAEELLALFGPTEIDERAATELRRLHQENHQWQEKCNMYIKIHDAVVRDNEKLYIENVRLKEAVAAEREACAAKAEHMTFDDEEKPQ